MSAKADGGFANQAPGGSGPDYGYLHQAARNAGGVAEEAGYREGGERSGNG